MCRPFAIGFLEIVVESVALFPLSRCPDPRTYCSRLYKSRLHSSPACVSDHAIVSRPDAVCGLLKPENCWVANQQPRIVVFVHAEELSGHLHLLDGS